MGWGGPPILVLVLLAAGCPGGPSSHPAPTPRPTVAKILAHLNQARDNAIAFRTDSQLDYLSNGERIKVDMPMMGKRGSRLRMTALSPAGGTTLADLACDGVGFNYIDYKNNCYLTGPCTEDSIRQMLRISMAPDDFLVLATGATPVIENAEGTVEWNSETRREVVKLMSKDDQAAQTIELDGEHGFWDVLESTKRDKNGNVEWRIQNKDFTTHKSFDGKTFRLPGKSKLEQPQEKADVEVRWFDERDGLRREINPELTPNLFQLAIPPGLNQCGAGAPSGTTP